MIYSVVFVLYLQFCHTFTDVCSEHLVCMYNGIFVLVFKPFSTQMTPTFGYFKSRMDR